MVSDTGELLERCLYHYFQLHLPCGKNTLCSEQEMYPSKSTLSVVDKSYFLNKEIHILFFIYFKSHGTAQCGQINKQVPKRKALTAMSCAVCDMSLLLSTSLFQLFILKLEILFILKLEKTTHVCTSVWSGREIPIHSWTYGL